MARTKQTARGGRGGGKPTTFPKRGIPTPKGGGPALIPNPAGGGKAPRGQPPAHRWWVGPRTRKNTTSSMYCLGKCSSEDDRPQCHTTRLLSELQRTKEVQVEAGDQSFKGDQILSEVYYVASLSHSLHEADSGNFPGL